jgi:hypothetical protein
MEAPTPESLSSEHTNILITSERTCAGLSMVAITLTAISFVCFKKLRTTPNLVLLFASIANAGASVASMMGYDGLKHGENSSLCQAQAFIFEWLVRPSMSAEVCSAAAELTLPGSCSRTPGGLLQCRLTSIWSSSTTRTQPVSESTLGFTALFVLGGLRYLQ